MIIPRKQNENNAGAAGPEPKFLTDLGNARRIVERHGRNLRYCHPWKTWLTWTGTHWAPDKTGEAVRRAKDAAAALHRWAANELSRLADENSEDDDERKARAAKLTKVLQHALRWQDARKLAASLELARSEPGIPILPNEMDRDPFVLNLLNGTIDLRSGTLRPHRREDLLTKIAPVAYDPEARCPLWERCLREWMSGNQQLTDYLQRIIGYALSADVSEQVLFFFYGLGNNGKSTFLKTILEALGDYGIQAVSELLMAKSNESHPTERADLFGRRLVATIEVDQGKRMAEAFVKQLTGGEKLRARRMRENFWEMEPTWKIILAANHKPVIRGTDYAVWRRIRLVPWTVTIREENKDKDLATKLRAEGSGILNWALRGFAEWRKIGLADPAEIKEATADYQRQQDTLANFIADCCITGDFAKVNSSALLDTYEKWSGDKTVTARAFRDRLRERGIESKRGHGGLWFFQGIGLPAQDFETL